MYANTCMFTFMLYHAMNCQMVFYSESKNHPVKNQVNQENIRDSLKQSTVNGKPSI